VGHEATIGRISDDTRALPHESRHVRAGGPYAAWSTDSPTRSRRSSRWSTPSR
jgi:hypothetical protein